MENISIKTILVTGGAGYIGSAIVEQLVNAGHSVVVFDDLSTGRIESLPASVKCIEGNITKIAELKRAFSSVAFDVVIHCAAKKVMNEGEEKPTMYYNDNVFGTLNVLECMSEYGVPHIIFSSTAAVYSPTSDGHPVVETDVVEPESVYGRSKLIAEMLVKDFARLKKISTYTILRYFNVAGDVGLSHKEPNPHGVFPLIARAFEKQEPFYVYGDDYETKDGSGVRDYIHLYDLAHAHVLALSSGESLTLNIGTSNGYTVYEVLHAFSEVTGKTLGAQIKHRRPGDVAVMLADASLAQEKISWSPKKTLRNMVQSTVSVYSS